VTKGLVACWLTRAALEPRQLSLFVTYFAGAGEFRVQSKGAL